MNDKLVLLSNCQTISLLKTDFHIMTQILRAVDKTHEVSICSKSYFFSKKHIILFSSAAFSKILETHQPFHVSCESNISKELLISCFNKIFFLFSISKEITISQKNAFGFRYLSKHLKTQLFF
jgi:hypothetical protein